MRGHNVSLFIPNITQEQTGILLAILGFTGDLYGTSTLHQVSKIVSIYVDTQYTASQRKNAVAHEVDKAIHRTQATLDNLNRNALPRALAQGEADWAHYHSARIVGVQAELQFWSNFKKTLER